MTGRRCGVVVIARDEEQVIGKCLESLRNQTVEMLLIVVVDGGTDRTGQIASKYADSIVNLPRHVESWSGRPELARVFNAGFEAIERKNLGYLLISGADCIFPPKYLEEVITRMEKEDFVVASGVAQGELSHSLSPRGSGRVISSRWFRSVGFRYPENFGFEVYLLYKALSQGLKIGVFSDLTFNISRETQLSKRKMYFWGKGMKALNYWWPYAIGRAVLAGIKHPSNGLAMLKGYLSKVPNRYEDIGRFVLSFQRKIVIRRLLEVLKP